MPAETKGETTVTRRLVMAYSDCGAPQGGEAPTCDHRVKGARWKHPDDRSTTKPAELIEPAAGRDAWRAHSGLTPGAILVIGTSGDSWRPVSCPCGFSVNPPGIPESSVGNEDPKRVPLSEAKPGQRVRFRNGREASVLSRSPGYMFVRFSEGREAHMNDWIPVELLPQQAAPMDIVQLLMGASASITVVEGPEADCACDGVGMCSAHVEDMVSAHPVPPLSESPAEPLDLEILKHALGWPRCYRNRYTATIGSDADVKCRRLEEAGLLASRVGEKVHGDGRPAMRTYHVTEAGKARLREEEPKALKVREVPLTEAQRKALTTTAKSIPSPAPGDESEVSRLTARLAEVERWLAEANEATTRQSVIAEDMRVQVASLRRQRMEMDCRYTMGDVADVGGSHCPAEKPCDRCSAEAHAAKAEAEVAKLKASLYCPECRGVIGTGRVPLDPCDCRDKAACDVLAHGDVACPTCERRVEEIARLVWAHHDFSGPTTLAVAVKAWPSDMPAAETECWRRAARAVLAELAKGGAS